MKRITYKLVVEDADNDTTENNTNYIKEVLEDEGILVVVSIEPLSTEDLPDEESDEDKENTNTENEIQN